MTRQNIILDTALIQNLKEILEEKKRKFEFLKAFYTGFSEKKCEFLINEKSSFLGLLIYIDWLLAIEEAKQIRFEIKSMEFKLKEFLNFYSNDSWDFKYEKAKSVEMEEVFISLFGISNFTQNVNCPLHEDKSPSLRVYGKTFYCFSCGKGGSAIDFIKAYKEYSVKEAIDYLSENF